MTACAVNRASSMSCKPRHEKKKPIDKILTNVCQD